MDQAEILGRLAVGYSPSYVAHIMKTRGVSFSPTASFLEQVKLAGGDGILVDRLSSADRSSSIASSTETNPPVDHLAKCAELMHAGDIESAQNECRESVQENPRSPWTVLAAAAAIRMSPFYGSPKDAEDSDKARLLQLYREAAALGSSLAAQLLALLSSSPETAAQWQIIGLPDQGESEEPNFSWDNGSGVWPYGFGPPQRIPDSAAASNEAIAIDPEARSSLEADPDLASTHVAFSNMDQFQAHDFESAERELREALRLEPDNADIHADLASLYFAHHDDEATLSELREAIRIVPFGAPQHMALAGELESLGRTAEAIAELQRTITMRPADTEVSAVLVQLDLDHKDGQGAMEELRRSLNASAAYFPDESGLVETRLPDETELAELLRQNHELDAAVEQYSYILRFQPDNAGVHNDYGNVLLDQNRLDEAIGEYNEALRIDPQMATAHHNIGICLARRKDLDGAVNEFRHALELNPDEPHSRVFLGFALGQQGDLNAAKDQFRQALEKNPKDPDTHAALGMAMYQLKDTPGAIKELKLALDLQPDSPEAENNLAWIYATTDDLKLRNPSEALVLARRAVDSSPAPNPAFLDTLAEALLLNGKPAEALALENQAIKLDPQNPDLQARLPRFRDAASKLVASKP